MADNINQSGDLFSKIKDYLNLRIDLIRYKMIDRVSLLFSALVSSILFFLISLIVVTFISIGLALYIGHVLGNSYFGFFIVGGIYLLLGVILFLIRGYLLKGPLRNWIIKALLD